MKWWMWVAIALFGLVFVSQVAGGEVNIDLRASATVEHGVEIWLTPTDANEPVYDVVAIQAALEWTPTTAEVSHHSCEYDYMAVGFFGGGFPNDDLDDGDGMWTWWADSEYVDVDQAVLLGTIQFDRAVVVDLITAYDPPYDYIETQVGIWGSGLNYWSGYEDRVVMRECRDPDPIPVP